MKNQPPPQNPSPSIDLNDVRSKIFDSKLVNTGVPGAIVGFAISQGFEGKWQNFGYLMATAAGSWLLIEVGSKVASRVDKAINQAETTFDQNIEKAWANLSRFHRQYLEALQTHCHNLKVEGYKGRLPRLVLEKVYVPLRVHQDQPQVRNQKSHLQGSLTIWDLLPKAHHPTRSFPERLLAVIADPGYGKTTLMRFLTLTFANRTHEDHAAKELLPILLLFREFYPRIQSSTQPSLPELIVETVQKLPRCGELHTSKPWFESQLDQGKCLVMLDGLDEVPEAQRELASQWANWQMQNYESQFILTSRPHGYDSSLFEGVQRIDILDFNNDQKRTFIQQWYRFITWEFTWKRHFDDSQYATDPKKRLSLQQVEAESNAEADTAAADLGRQLFADQTMTDLAKNPLLITIIAATHETSENLPKRRVNLYREIFKLLLEYRPNRRDTRLTLTSAEDNQAILQTLALKLTEAEKTQFSPSEGSKWIKEKLADVNPEKTLTPQQFLREIQQVSGLLAGGESNLYEFTHKTFQEYLTAVELSQSQGGQRKVMDQFTNENWREVIYFFATLTDPLIFINAALEDGTNFHSLELAYRLANDSSRVDEQLKVQLITALEKLTPDMLKIRLQKRFQTLSSLGTNTAISTPITGGEYQLFLIDQINKQFHSWAEDEHIDKKLNTLDFGNLHWEDTRWFCAWLSTQPQLVDDQGVYHFRLPKLEEAQTADHPLTAGGKTGVKAIPWTTDRTKAGNVFQVVRERIPNRYANLVNYLASGSWKEADKETYDLMLTIAGIDTKKRQYLELDEIKNFPCEDLLIIDELWVKFSGGKFGFSVQQELWIEVGGKLDFGADEDSAMKAFQEMSDRNGWSKASDAIGNIIYDISAPNSYLPASFIIFGFHGGIVIFRGGVVLFLSSIASRLVNCDTGSFEH